MRVTRVVTVPSCTNLMELKSVVDDFIGRTVTNMQLGCHFINRHPSVVKNQRVDLFSVPSSRRCGLVPWSLFVTLVQHVNSLIHFSLRKTISQYCADSLWWLTTHLTPSSHKNLMGQWGQSRIKIKILRILFDLPLYENKTNNVIRPVNL